MSSNELFDSSNSGVLNKNSNSLNVGSNELNSNLNVSNSESRVAVVTGSSRGIGAEIVKRLASNGYNVVLNYNSSFENAQEICSMFDNVYMFKADVSNVSEVKKLIDFTFERFKRIDLLVNNAGCDLIKMISDTSFDEFDKLIKTNLYSAYFASKFASEIMVRAKSGNIINISSIWGNAGSSMETAYSVSKAGIDGLTKSLAKELGPSNIRVNSIAPGIIDTSMNSFLSDEELSSIVSDIPLERVGTCKDVADVVMMLETCSYITGQVIAVNGGWDI